MEEKKRKTTKQRRFLRNRNKDGKQTPRGKLNFFTKIALIVFAAFCVFSIYSMQTQVTDLKKQVQTTDEQITQTRENIAALEESLLEPYDEKFIEQTARERLGYGLAGETIFYNDLPQ